MDEPWTVELNDTGGAERVLHFPAHRDLRVNEVVEWTDGSRWVIYEVDRQWMTAKARPA